MQIRATKDNFKDSLESIRVVSRVCLYPLTPGLLPESPLVVHAFNCLLFADFERERVEKGAPNQFASNEDTKIPFDVEDETKWFRSVSI